ncbi:class I SAM-dependent methyltransferase [Olleya marilimosa]|uniref:Methyltransferase domain-containing protein n=1 Tax=Olleya marilimosa TaxID=272164 RepID=A0ABR8LQE7_9FLAO|nr:class I SAM-dependent methyltransferase [Olleya marilimosa]MBD3862457.1 methyltransferase domain-containing protein [Olleya marilimosa]MBD3889956.1 methyltransferase domain-containing protein [Olleya marilimosa]
MKTPKTPWPTKAAMQQVYKMNLWGSNASEFYSGEGSHNPELVNPYIEAIVSFLKTLNTPISVCDLGCGDFNIGSKLFKYTSKYFAIDIVPELIDHNKSNFKAKNLSFSSLDIAKDDLPPADCALIRQVLQHLSNAEVQNILNKLQAYKYVIITEHIPLFDFTPNLDIISGQGIRLKKQSGLDVLKAPFNFKVTSQEELLTINLKDGKGKIVTTKYTLY